MMMMMMMMIIIIIIVSQLLNVRWVNDIRQTEIPTTGQLVSEPSAIEFERVIEKLKRQNIMY
jgi:hypothetical protein